MSTMLAASPSELLMKVAAKAASRRGGFARRRLVLIIGLAMLGIAIAAILTGPLWLTQSPTAIDVLHPLAPPLTPGHLLGTDQYGRDILARIIYGGRIASSCSRRTPTTYSAIRGKQEGSSGGDAEAAQRNRSTMSPGAKPPISSVLWRNPLNPGASRSMSRTKTLRPLATSA